jgi:hypothetical protein
MVCHGALQDIGTEAARCLGGFGAEEKEQECEEGEEGELAKPEDFEVFGEEQHSIEDAPRTPKEQADAKKLADLSAAQDALEQLPDVNSTGGAVPRDGDSRGPGEKEVQESHRGGKRCTSSLDY